MKTKEVLLLLTDNWADWEASYAISGVNMVEQYTVKTIAVDDKPKVSVGGLRTEIDYTIDQYEDLDNCAMVILTGGYSWREGEHPEIKTFVADAHGKGIPVAAICGATAYLEKHGFIDHSDPEQVVNKNDFITADERSALEFAREILLTLKAHSDEDVEGWYGYFKNAK